MPMAYIYHFDKGLEKDSHKKWYRGEMYVSQDKTRRVVFQKHDYL